MRYVLFYKLFLVAISSCLILGCATIIHGSKQDVGVSSSPTSANVIVDNQSMGQTPMTATLSRKDHHTVRIELEGYQLYETRLTRKASGWVFGNIIFGGIPGLIVDAITGGLYKLTPEQVEAELRKSETALIEKNSDIFISVVLQPDPGWEKIGQLKKVGSQSK